MKMNIPKSAAWYLIALASILFEVLDLGIFSNSKWLTFSLLAVGSISRIRSGTL